MAHFYFLMMVLVGITSQRFAVAVEPAPLIPASSNPCSLAVLAVHYPSFGDDCGETVSLDLVYEGNPSVVSYAGADQTKLYTLMMVDPDAPDVTDPKFAYYLHWLIVNIEGGDLSTGVFANGAVLTSYQHPLPELGSGLHRYQFFIFEQALRLDISAQNSRAFFDVGMFMSDNGLTGPLAGYQFLSEETPLVVPTVHSDSTVQGPTNSTSAIEPTILSDSTVQGSTNSTSAVEPTVHSDSTVQGSTNLTSGAPNDGVTATTPSAGAVILKGNAVMLVTMALFAVVQLAR